VFGVVLNENTEDPSSSSESSQTLKCMSLMKWL